MTLDTKARYFGVPGLVAVFGLALVQCGAAADDERTATSRQSIVAGTVASTTGSPVVYLEGPQGTCTAIIIAPNLVATARHCTAQLVEGPVSCDSEGNLIDNGSGAGQLGDDDSPGALSFFSAANVASGHITSTPDAVGVQILSTQWPNICADDLAFVVLDHPIAGLMPASIRIDSLTAVDENVSVFGYGLTDVSMAPVLLRVRENAQIVGIGPDAPTSVPQAAPLRSLRVGPGVVTCNGDSGGPIMSMASGALVGLVSLGTQASSKGAYCSNGTTADTTGPELSNYKDLVLSAFKAAGASPILEMPPSDGGVDGARPPPKDAAAPPDADDGAPSGPVEFLAAGSSCRVGVAGGSRSGPWGALACGIAMMVVAVGRRRR
jgi:hypothetical protein